MKFILQISSEGVDSRFQPEASQYIPVEPASQASQQRLEMLEKNPYSFSDYTPKEHLEFETVRDLSMKRSESCSRKSPVSHF